MLKNIVTVVTDDAVLVADTERVNDVRDVVDHLEKLDISLKLFNTLRTTGRGDGLKVWLLNLAIR